MKYFAYSLLKRKSSGHDMPDHEGRTVTTRLHSEYGHEKGRELWANPHLKQYEMQHGMHFSEKMVAYACKKMHNRNGAQHYWTKDEVKSAVTSMGYKIPHDVYWCDLQYIANMAYADYFGSSLRTETDCLMWACDYINDPDGYPEKAFNHYLADLMHCQQCDVPWRDMI